jgi:purine-nucleoside/S-methyl-5'-thioadenosine phosphorylase / adenosine deaminase
MSLPKPSGDFEWVQESWGTALRCVPLAEIAPHCFSTRDLALEGVREDEHPGWEDLARAFGIDYPSLVRLRQVHGAGVFEAENDLGHPTPTPFPYDNWPEADIAVSRDSSIALTVRTADCVPILLADRRNNAVAAVHAGWRGTAAGAVMVAVEALLRRFGSTPTDLVAAVGPSIGPCCYEVRGDVIAQFAAHADAAKWFSTDSPLRLDLWRATRDQLERAGLPSRQIHLSALCTAHHPGLFHSYRRDGNAAGRLVAAIRSSPGTKP